MQPPTSPVNAPSLPGPQEPASPVDATLGAEAKTRRDPSRDAIAKVGLLLVDLADQATQLSTLLCDEARAKNLAGGLGRRAELTRLLGRKLSLFSDARVVSTTALVNDAILSLDGIAVDIEYAADFATETRMKNQVARCRLAVVTAGSAIHDARHVLALRA